MLGKRRSMGWKKPASKKPKYSNKRKPPNWRQPGAANERIHYVKRNVNLGSMTTSNATPTLNAYNFSISDCNNYTELTSLYDQYKICGVRFRMFPKQTGSTSLGVTDSVTAGRVISAIDYTDSTPPASTDELREYESCKVTSFYDQHERYIPAPKYVNNSNEVTDQWAPTSNVALNWNGLKVTLDPSGSTATNQQLYVIECTYYMCFKNIK